MGDDDWRKPQIGVASSWNEITPCNLSLDRLAKQAKVGVRGGRRVPARVRHHLGLGRHLDGPRRHALLAGVARGHRRLGRDGVSGRATRRGRPAGGVRQVDPGHADGGGPARRGDGVPVRRVDAARALQRPRRHHHRRVRGGRGVPGRPDHPRRGRRDRAGDLPGRRRLRRHVHRQHDGLGRRGARHVAARQRLAAGARLPPRRPTPSARGRPRLRWSTPASPPGRS